MIQDTQVKTGGSDASTPMGTGLAINVITKSGGNSFKGTAGYAYQPLNWSSDNTGHKTVFDSRGRRSPRTTTCPNKECTQPAARRCSPTSVSSTVRSAGRSREDRVWFFTSFRKSAVETQISRNQKSVDDIKALLSQRRVVPPADQGVPAVREGHLACRRRPRAVWVLPARPHPRPEQLELLLRSHQRVFEWRQRLQRQAHVGMGLETDDDVFGRLQQQERQQTTTPTKRLASTQRDRISSSMTAHASRADLSPAIRSSSRAETTRRAPTCPRRCRCSAAT